MVDTDWMCLRRCGDGRSENRAVVLHCSVEINKQMKEARLIDCSGCVKLLVHGTLFSKNFFHKDGMYNKGGRQMILE